MVRPNEAMLFICDKDGYAKAQSKPLSLEKGQQIYKKMIKDGMIEFKGTIKTVS
jgi:hypothetical protein